MSPDLMLIIHVMSNIVRLMKQYTSCRIAIKCRVDAFDRWSGMFQGSGCHKPFALNHLVCP